MDFLAARLVFKAPLKWVWNLKFNTKVLDDVFYDKSTFFNFVTYYMITHRPQTVFHEYLKNNTLLRRIVIIKSILAVWRRIKNHFVYRKHWTKFWRRNAPPLLPQCCLVRMFSIPIHFSESVPRRQSVDTDGGLCNCIHRWQKVKFSHFVDFTDFNY